MATLTGNLADITNQVPETVVSITVKAPAARVGGNGLSVSSPANVQYNQETGLLTITNIDNGLSWLVIEGDEWSDHINLAVAEGFTLIAEAVANAQGALGLVDYLALLGALQSNIAGIAEAAVAEAADTIMWYQPSLDSAALIDTFWKQEHKGVYPVPSPSISANLGLPLSERGTLHVYWVSGGLEEYANTTQLWITTPSSRLFSRSRATGGTWSEWKELGGEVEVPNPFVKGILSAEDSLDDFVREDLAGIWQNTSTPVAEALGLPAPDLGGLVNIWAAGSSEPYYTGIQVWMPVSGDIYKRTIKTGGTWTEWKELGGAGDVPQIPVGSAEMRTSLMQASKGGQIGTAGRGVVSLRFDHNLGGFDAILPLLRERSLPATMALYVDMMAPVAGYSNDDSYTAGKTWADVTNNFQRGVEVFSHSWSHQDASTFEDIYNEVVNSRNQLETYIPAVRVHGWNMPGIGGTQYMGWWQDWVEPKSRSEHVAGQLLSATYGTWNVSGYGYNELGKTQTRYHGIESNTTSTNAKNLIDTAIDTCMGVTLMVHPNQIGRSGYMSLAVFTEVLDHIAQRRDAGDLVVLSQSGQACATPAHGWRHSLTPTDPAKWSGTGTLTYTLNTTRVHDSLGAVREFEVECSGTGDVLLRADSSSANMAVYRTVPVGSDGKARLQVGIPRGATNIVFSATPTGVSISKIGVYAV